MPQSRQLLNTVFMVTVLGLLFPQVTQAALVERAGPIWLENRLELPLAESTRIAQADPRQAEADRLNAEGIEQYNQANYPEALELFQQSLAIRQDIGDRRGVGASLNNIGFIYDSQGDYPQALDYYQQALAIRQDIGDRRGEGTMLNNIGFIYSRQGDYPQALDYFQQALAIRQDIGDRRGVGASLNNIGGIYSSQGDYPQALDYYQQALAISQDIGDRRGVGESLNNIGFIYSRQGDYPQALDYFQQALAIRQDIGDRRGVGESLNNIGFIYSRQGDYPQALDYFQQALAISQDIGDRSGEGATLNNIGVIYDSQGNYPQALDYYQQSLAISQDISAPELEAASLANIGRWFEQQEQPALAILFFKQAVNTYEVIRTNNQDFSSQELQQSYTETVADDYRALADLLLQQNRVLEAQRVIDLLKVQELDDTLRGVRGNSSTASGVPLLEEEKTLLARSQQIFQQGIGISQELGELRQIPLAERTVANNERIFALENLQSELLTTFLDFVASPEVTDLIANLSDIAKQSDLITKLASDEFINLRNNLADIDNAALIYPLILENRLELVLVTSSGPPTHYPITVDEDTLRDTVFEFQQALRDKTSTPEPLAQQLYDWVIPEALETAFTQQGIETILYAPDGILRYIPLAALHTGDQWLIERYQINHITAASLTDLNLEDDPEPLVLAGAFSEGNHPSPAGDLWGLPYAGVEVEKLADLLPTSPLLLNKEFSLAGTAPLMNDHTIVHFATHAAFLVESPLESFIMFGNGDRLTLQELKNWRGRFSNVDLVVLSACETGVGNVRDADGEEILGFGYLMQTAGASAAMASLWQVSDGGTQILMTEFYQALKDGLGKAEALQHAQRTLIGGEGVNLADVERIIGQRPADAETIYSQLSHPYYWAPFILIGNGL
ncbi:tetratricopeptide repeat protein [Leptothoe sp. LEGE 181152]|nr:tetratricopeptide repeat protein [Leptothoe sp. LEGE 181152]